MSRVCSYARIVDKLGGYPSKIGQTGQTLMDRANGRLWIVVWWAHQDSNLEPRDYESPALTVEL